MAEIKNGRVKILNEYRGGLTRDFIIMGGVNIVIASALIYFGIEYKKMITWVGLGFMVMGVLLIGGLAMLLCFNFRKSISIDKSGIIYNNGDNAIIIPWNDISAFYPPDPGKKFFKTAVIGDKLDTFQIDSFTFADFDEIMDKIIAEKQKRKPGKIHRYSVQ
ncbi:MAG: hypothetical protein J7M18_03270 [Candidatus Eremiobacteraeota bacterium]|nr:hypothetical protein [Candidatus Eremiobacteraeota bacterium]